MIPKIANISNATHIRHGQYHFFKFNTNTNTSDGPNLNTNTNTNTWLLLMFNTNTNTWTVKYSIPIPIPILAKNSIPQYQYQYLLFMSLNNFPNLSQNQSNMMKGSNFTAFYVTLDTFYTIFGPIIEYEMGLGIGGSIGQYQYQYL